MSHRVAVILVEANLNGAPSVTVCVPVPTKLIANQLFVLGANIAVLSVQIFPFRLNIATSVVPVEPVAASAL